MIVLRVLSVLRVLRFARLDHLESVLSVLCNRCGCANAAHVYVYTYIYIYTLNYRYVHTRQTIRVRALVYRVTGFHAHRIDAELLRRVDLALMVCGKSAMVGNTEDGLPAAPTSPVGEAFGASIDLTQLLTKVNQNVKSDCQIASIAAITLSDCISHHAALIPHLPVESLNIPSEQELAELIAAVAQLSTRTQLQERSLEYAKKEELLQQVINAMSTALKPVKKLNDEKARNDKKQLQDKEKEKEKEKLSQERAESQGKHALKRKMVQSTVFLHGSAVADGARTIPTATGDTEFTKMMATWSFTEPLAFAQSESITGLLAEKDSPEKPGYWIGKWHF